MIKNSVSLPRLRGVSFGAAVVVLMGLLGCGGASNKTPIIGCGGSCGGGGTVGPEFFGMHINNINSPLPGTVGVPIHGVRLWDTQTSWATTNTSDGNYDWTKLDGRVNQAVTAKLDVLYDLGRTPVFAQCPNTDTGCGSGNTTIVCAYTSVENTPGDCFPPSDLNTDGTGTNQRWIDWVTAVASRYKGQIAYYEIWNEPNIPEMWQGTTAQLVRMAGDARCIIIGDKGCSSQSSYSQKGVDPAAKLLTPAFTYPVTDLATYVTGTTSAVSGNGGSFADVVAFHGYPGGGNPPENVLGDFNTAQNAANASASQPVFDTEGSWGSGNLTDPDQQASFTARYLMVLQSAGVQRMYWYAWDLYTSGDGDLWAPPGSGSGLTSVGLTKAGVAYQQTETWLSGATVSSTCSNTGSVWTCGYTRSGGYQALAVWDTSQTCNNGNCTTSNFSAPSQYTQYQDLAGNTTAVSGGTVKIGAKPILLETGRIP
jgi:hypothetical protein